jgi:hypothetical protein
MQLMFLVNSQRKYDPKNRQLTIIIRYGWLAAQFGVFFD